MGVIVPSILFGRVMHKRMFECENAFAYGIYYMACPLQDIPTLRISRWFGVERFAPMSFFRRDHGQKDGTALEPWARNILADYGLNDIVSDITLICMPRVLGYVFNPVSFWLCHDAQGHLRAVIYAVNNTFGEAHAYICAHADHRIIAGDDWLEADKLFHVSPFLKREGQYKFRINHQGQKLGIWIDYYDADGRRKLLTSLTGTLRPWSRDALKKAFFKHPLVTLLAVARIHWQAVKLVFKKIKYIPKPVQLTPKTSNSHNLTKK